MPNSKVHWLNCSVCLIIVQFKIRTVIPKWAKFGGSPQRIRMSIKLKKVCFSVRSAKRRRKWFKEGKKRLFGIESIQRTSKFDHPVTAVNPRIPVRTEKPKPIRRTRRWFASAFENRSPIEMIWREHCSGKKQARPSKSRSPAGWKAATAKRLRFCCLAPARAEKRPYSSKWKYFTQEASLKAIDDERRNWSE